MSLLSIPILLLFVFLGALGGFLAGLLGIGGGIIFVPLFLWVFPAAGFSSEVVVHAAFGTSLAVIIPTAITSTLAHRRRGNVDWHQVFRLAIGALTGVLIGGTVAAILPGELLKLLFGLMQVMAGLNLVLRPRHLPPETAAGPPVWQLVLVGFLTGAFSVFFGVGGGIIAVPLMIILLRLPTQLAIGNSSALITVSSFLGAGSYILHGWQAPGLPPFSLGYVNLLVALIAAPSAIGAAGFGVRIASRLGDDKLLKAFALLLIGIGLRIVIGYWW